MNSIIAFFLVNSYFWHNKFQAFTYLSFFIVYFILYLPLNYLFLLVNLIKACLYCYIFWKLLILNGIIMFFKFNKIRIKRCGDGWSF